MPAGFPLGSPGSGELIDGAMQQAAQPGRQPLIGNTSAAMLRAAADCMQPGDAFGEEVPSFPTALGPGP